MRWGEFLGIKRRLYFLYLDIYCLGAEYLLSGLKVNLDDGIDETSVEDRSKAFGSNIVASRPP